MFRLLSVALAVAITASAQVGPLGHWEGAVASSNAPSKITLDLARNTRGVWVASLGVPEKNVSGLRAADVAVEGPKVSFIAIDFPGKPPFRLIWKERSLGGFMLAQGKEIPVNFTLAGEPKVELPEPLQPVSKALEGDWEGTLPLTNNRTRPVAVHFRNQPDETASATLDSLTQGMKDALLHRIVEDGNSISFAVRSYGGSYKGLRNEDGSEIKGEWTQNPGQKSIPLIFRKK
ncbi:MAG: hypothetical protein SGI92_01240 [Bryobacteraceae bacterium]|nr:hypothetical protein [Bryobacteraceae bacterium]